MMADGHPMTPCGGAWEASARKALTPRPALGAPEQTTSRRHLPAGLSAKGMHIPITCTALPLVFGASSIPVSALVAACAAW